MEYVLVLILLFTLAFAFLKAYGRKVGTFKGPWIVDASVPARTRGLVDEYGRTQRQLVGLTLEETREFEKLDQLDPLDA